MSNVRNLIQAFGAIVEPYSITPAQLAHLLDLIYSSCDEARDYLQKVSGCTAYEAVQAVNALTYTLGQPGGIATLDADGKVPDEQLPPSVYDYVEFDGFYNISNTDNILDEIPEDHQSIAVGAETSGGYTIQFGGIMYCTLPTPPPPIIVPGEPLPATPQNGFYDVYDLYSGHSLMGTYFLKLPEINKYGTIDPVSGAAVPSKNKLYAYSHELWRWTGSEFEKYGHTPLSLGQYSGTAYPGDEGKQLRDDLDKEIYARVVQFDSLLAFSDCLNLTNSHTKYNEPFDSVAEAFEYLGDTLGCSPTDVYPAPGARVRFLLQNGDSARWVVYQLMDTEDYWNDMIEEEAYELADMNRFSCNPKYWQELDAPPAGEGAGGGGLAGEGASCDCAADVAALKQYTNLLGSNALLVKQKINSAYDTANACSQDISGLSTRVTALEEGDNNGNNPTADNDKIEFAKIEEISGIITGSGSGKYTITSDAENLNIIANPTNADIEILLPTTADFEGKTIRILDPRTKFISNSYDKKVKIGFYPNNSNYLIIGAEKEDNTTYLSFKSGYVELLGFRSFRQTSQTATEPNNQTDWILKTKVTL